MPESNIFSNPFGNNVPSFSFAGLPVSYPVGALVWVNNIGDAVMGANPVAATGSLWYFNGAIWKPASGRVTLAKLNTAITGLTNSEAVSAQLLLSAGFLRGGDRLEMMISGTKSGTSDTGGVRIRMGTAGTTSDTALVSSTMMVAGNLSARGKFEFRLTAATTVAPLSLATGVDGGSANAFSDVTITNISNALYINFGMVSSSTNDTTGLRDIVLTLIR